MYPGGIQSFSCCVHLFKFEQHYDCLPCSQPSAFTLVYCRPVLLLLFGKCSSLPLPFSKWKTTYIYLWSSSMYYEDWLRTPGWRPFITMKVVHPVHIRKGLLSSWFASMLCGPVYMCISVFPHLLSPQTLH